MVALADQRVVTHSVAGGSTFNVQLKQQEGEPFKVTSIAGGPSQLECSWMVMQSSAP
jgi:hypothetical protein